MDTSLQVKITNKQILQIALPISASLIIPNINFITNNIFLGGLGERELGNAGTVGVFYLIFMMSGNGVSQALQALISRKGGEGNLEAINVYFTQGIRIALQFAVIGILLTWFVAPLCLKPFIGPENFQQEMEFLRIRVFGLPFLYLFQIGNAFLIATLNGKYLLIGTIGQAIINIFLDYVLIYGALSFPQLGFNGAAYASVIAEASGMLIVLLVIYNKGLKKKFNLFKNFKYNRVISFSVLKMALPLIAQFAISLVTWLIFFILLESYGERAKAISNAMRNVFGVVGIFIWAFASTTNTMVSNLIGQGLQSKVIAAINKITLLSVLFSVSMLGLLNLFPEIFLGLFGQGDDFIREAIPVVQVTSLGMLAMSIAAVWLNAVTGSGKTSVNLLIEMIAVLVYLVYIYFVMVRDQMSLAMAWTNEIVYWVVIFGMAFIYMKRTFSKNRIGALPAT